ncbi:MAG: polyphosphate:AMP phosphotransferase [Candidatus Nanopelagicales bacterium]|jgi:polyphosphate:AMP phosphotransferase|nr:polyphosphate:AMP phosphotransferase [Candidatus Nanopelagicales bacterium]
MLEAAETGARLSKAEYAETVPQLRVDLINAQYDLRLADFPVIVIIAGDDRLAANELVNRLNEWLDARYLRTHVLGDLTSEESERPRFWRLWQSLPPKGQIAVWAGGLFRQVHAYLRGETTAEELATWSRHLESLQDQLLADGALVVKFFLHSGRREQKARLKGAERDPELGWRVDQRDWARLDELADARPVVERLLRQFSAPGSPWNVVEATDARYRDVTVARILRDALLARLAQAGAPPPAAAVSMFSGAGRSALTAVDLAATIDRAEYRKRLNVLQARLHRLSLEARDRGLTSVLAFEGWDAAGKGGTIRRITQALEAGDYRVIPTAAPTEEERRYHYLWRFWRDLPRAGTTVIYDRTWYGRVLVERVEGFAQPGEWQRAYDEINDFEEQLAERGYYVAKFWLHLSPEEQLARFQARADTPYKQHKITDEDWRNRERWDDYAEAVEETVARTSTDRAPWYVIPANDKRWARIAVLEAVTKGLKRSLRQA